MPGSIGLGTFWLVEVDIAEAVLVADLVLVVHLAPIAVLVAVIPGTIVPIALG
jgi:hypothetical protein